MIRGKRIAIVQGVVATVFAGVAALQAAGWGGNYSLLEDDADGRQPQRFARIAGEPAKLGPWDQYAEMLSRPLFNESRQPEEVATPTATEGEGTAKPLTETTLTGIILAGPVKIAMITNSANGETQRVKLGQPLEGDQSGWSLVELKPRSAVFEGAGAGRTELELTVDTKGATPAPPAVAQVAAPPGTAPPNQGAVPPPPPPPNPTAVPPPGQPASADEIRRRIEERRKQLREEAQRMLQEQNQNQ